MELVAAVSRGLIALVFLASAASKVRPADHREFRASVRRTGLVPARAVRPAALLVVALEAAVVPLVLVPATAPLGAALAALLLVGFVGVIVVSVRTGRAVECRCFGAGATLGAQHVARNAFLLLACLGATQAPPPFTAGAAPQLACGFVVAGLLALAVTRLDDVLDLLRHRTVLRES